MALAVSRRIVFDGSQDDTSGLTKVVETIDINEQEKYTAGVWVRAAVTVSGATNIDFNTYFSDGFGNTINFATLKELWLWNTDDTNTVTVTGNIKTLFQGGDTDDPVLDVDGWLVRIKPAGWTIVNLASDTLTLTPSAGSPVVNIYVLGAE